MNRYKMMIFGAVLGVTMSCGSPQSTHSTNEPIRTSELGTMKVIPRSVDHDGPQRREAIVTAHGNLFEALKNTSDQLPVWQKPLPNDLEASKILSEDRAFTGSMSRGSVSSGTMMNAVKIEHVGDHHEIINRHRKYKTSYGTKSLVDVLKHAAYVVSSELGGAKLRIGNMSYASGGDIRWSRSHNSGRDADIGFYVLDEKGESVPLPDLASFDENGSSRRYPKLRFDVARNWKLVEAMVTHDVGVQWLFISIPLKKLLLDHARKIDADPEVIARAEMVLHQPTDSSPHADHFHLRIACPVKDRVEGCLPSGPNWPWLPDTNPAMLARVKVLVKEIESGDKPAEALEMLQTIRAPQRAEIALWMIISNTRPELHKRAAQIARKPFVWRPYALHHARNLLKTPHSPHHKDALFIGRRALDPETWSLMLASAKDSSLPAKQRAAFVDALIHWSNAELLDELVPMLGDDKAVASSALHVLQHLTNHRGPFETLPNKQSSREELVASWKLFAQNEGRDVEIWQRGGFVVQGVKDPDDVDALVAHMKKAPKFGAYNANRRLRELTGRWSPLEFDDVSEIQTRWKKWVDRNRDRLLVAQLYPQVFTGEHEDFTLTCAENGWWQRLVDLAPKQEPLFASNSE